MQYGAKCYVVLCYAECNAQSVVYKVQYTECNLQNSMHSAESNVQIVKQMTQNQLKKANGMKKTM